MLPALVAAAIPWAVTSVYLTEARVRHRSGATVLITATLRSPSSVPALVLVPEDGIDGAATAFLAGNIVAAVVALGTHLQGRSTADGPSRSRRPTTSSPRTPSPSPRSSDPGPDGPPPAPQPPPPTRHPPPPPPPPTAVRARGARRPPPPWVPPPAAWARRPRRGLAARPPRLRHRGGRPPGRRIGRGRAPIASGRRPRPPRRAGTRGSTDLADFVEDERGLDFDHPVYVDFLTPDGVHGASHERRGELRRRRAGRARPLRRRAPGPRRGVRRDRPLRRLQPGVRRRHARLLRPDRRAGAGPRHGDDRRPRGHPRPRAHPRPAGPALRPRAARRGRSSTTAPPRRSAAWPRATPSAIEDAYTEEELTEERAHDLRRGVRGGAGRAARRPPATCPRS